jgi:hypothetical protein
MIKNGKNNFVRAASIFIITLFVLLLLSCTDVLNSPSERGNPGSNAGAGGGITITINEDSEDARTILPPAEDLLPVEIYVLSFTSEDASHADIDITSGSSETVYLRDGTWTISANGYADEEKTQLIASGTSASFTVPGISTISIPVSRLVGSETGTLAIKVPASTSSLTLTMQKDEDDGLSETPTSYTETDFEESDGAYKRDDLSVGSYLMNLSLTLDNGRTLRFIEAVYILPYQTTTWDVSGESEQFTFTITDIPTEESGSATINLYASREALTAIPSNPIATGKTTLADGDLEFYLQTSGGTAFNNSGDYIITLSFDTSRNIYYYTHGTVTNLLYDFTNPPKYYVSYGTSINIDQFTKHNNTLPPEPQIVRIVPTGTNMFSVFWRIASGGTVSDSDIELLALSSNDKISPFVTFTSPLPSVIDDSVNIYQNNFIFDDTVPTSAALKLIAINASSQSISSSVENPSIGTIDVYVVGGNNAGIGLEDSPMAYSTLFPTESDDLSIIDRYSNVNVIVTGTITDAEPYTIPAGKTVSIEPALGLTTASITRTIPSILPLFEVSGNLTIQGNVDALTFTGSSDASNVSLFIVINNGIFTMNDNAHITGNTIGGNGAAVYINGGTFNMNGGTISGNVSGNNGGAVDMNNGTITMTGGTISGNKSTATGDSNGGGGVHVYGGTFTMSGGTIEENQAARGGGVYLSSAAAQFIMEDGTISGNTVGGSGGGVYSEAGTFTMSGGTISENTANTNGGGVYVANYADFTMTNGDILGNNASTNGGGVSVSGTAASFLMQGGAIGQNDDAKRNTADNGGGVYVYQGEFTMNNDDGDAAPVIAGNIADVFGGGVFIDDTTFTMTTSSIELNQAVQGGGAYISGTSSFTMNTGANVSRNTTVQIGGTGAPPGDGYGGGVFFSSSGTFTMNTGSSITGNQAAANGGGVSLMNGIFDMQGGEISGGDLVSNAANGGGVYMFSGTFTMSSGSITENKVTTDGGGVYVGASGTFDHQDGGITGNTATVFGGGVRHFDTGDDPATGSFVYNPANVGQINGNTDDTAGTQSDNVYPHLPPTIETLGDYLEGLQGGDTLDNPAVLELKNINITDDWAEIKSIIESSEKDFIKLDISGCSFPNNAIGRGTFANCGFLAGIILPNELETIGPSAFEGSPLTEIDIPDTVTSLGDHAFFNCAKLISINSGTAIKTLGDSAFSGCSSLESVIIAAGLTPIPYGAFLFCEKLTSVRFEGPGTVTDNSNGYNGFDGDLKTKYENGGAGTYTREANGTIWTKQP